MSQTLTWKRSQLLNWWVAFVVSGYVQRLCNSLWWDFASPLLAFWCLSMVQCLRVDPAFNLGTFRCRTNIWCMWNTTKPSICENYPCEDCALQLLAWLAELCWLELLQICVVLIWKQLCNSGSACLLSERRQLLTFTRMKVRHMIKDFYQILDQFAFVCRYESFASEKCYLYVNKINFLYYFTMTSSPAFFPNSDWSILVGRYLISNPRLSISISVTFPVVEFVFPIAFIIWNFVWIGPVNVAHVDNIITILCDEFWRWFVICG